MESKYLLGAAFAVLSLTLSAGAETVPLDVSNVYNFQLAGGGGSAEATLGTTAVQIYCDNFANEINLGQDYTADVTVLSTTANLSLTRFGNVSASSSTKSGTTGWEPITLTDGNPVDGADDKFFNSGAGLAPLERYEMVAYLISQYNFYNTTTGNEIQEAIWTLLDPTSEGPVGDPSGSNPDYYLEEAASWVQGMNNSNNLTALNAFLAHFEVVSDSTMSFPSPGAATGGFQEQIVDLNPVPPPTPTPEPRGGALALGGLLAGGALLAKRSRDSRIHAAS